FPTDAEWEFACRAGTTSLFSFGDAEEMADKFAWHVRNSTNMSHPVGLLKPNLRGLFDMHGNALEWCQGKPHPAGDPDQAREELPDITKVQNEDTRPLAGGFFNDGYSNIRSSSFSHAGADGRVRASDVTFEIQYCGFRVARTIYGTP